jgi:hypothetical protein
MANLEPALLYIGNASDQVVYTCQKKYSLIKSVNVCNNSAGERKFSIHLLADGFNPGPTNALINDVTITGNNVLDWDTSIVIPETGEIFILQETGNDLTFTISGVENVI